MIRWHCRVWIEPVCHELAYNGTIGEYTTSGAIVNASLVSGLIIRGHCRVRIEPVCRELRRWHDWRIHHVGSDVNASLVSGLSYPNGIAVSGSDLFVTNTWHRHDWRIHHVGSNRERLPGLGVEWAEWHCRNAPNLPRLLSSVSVSGPSGCWYTHGDGGKRVPCRSPGNQPFPAMMNQLRKKTAQPFSPCHHVGQIRHEGQLEGLTAITDACLGNRVKRL